MAPGDDSTALGWWKQFITQFVQHVNMTFGPGVLAGLEVWNEENYWPCGWSEASPTDADPIRFTRVLCYAFGGSFAADQSVPVVLGGIASPGNDNWTDKTYGNSAGGTFLQKAYTAKNNGGSDIRNCMNAVGIHTYNVNNTTGAWAGPKNTTYPFWTGPQLFGQTACNNGDCGRPIWITELGYPTTNPPSTTDQANWEQQAYQYATGVLPNPWPSAVVNMLLISTLFEFSANDLGVCTGPGVALPAASALKQFFSNNPNAQATC